MKILARTWARDEHELIDYENQDLVDSSIDINNSGYVFRKKNSIFYNRKQKGNNNNNNIQKLLKITFTKKDIEIIPNKCEFNDNGDIANNNSAWFINSSCLARVKERKYKCKENEIIKFGKITFLVKKIHFQPEKLIIKKGYDKNDINIQLNHSYNEKTVPKNDDKKSYFSEKISQKKQKTCRICYSAEEDPNNPLVQPCLCTGSLKYIHLSCLKQWINTKFYIKKDSNSLCITYLIKKAECELCKTQFPDYISHNDRLYDIKNIESCFNNYLILESLTLDIHKYKVVYIVSLDNIEQPIIVGRAKGSHIFISDISVSRIHCKIIIDNNKNIFFEDNFSKFGTLILIQAPKIILCDNLNLNIQIGRSFISCKIKQKFNLFKCCQAEEKPDIYYYYKQNTSKNFITKPSVKTEIYSIENDDNEEEDKIENRITYENNNDKDSNDNKENEKEKDKKSEKDNDGIKSYVENKNNIQNENIDVNNIVHNNNNDNYKRAHNDNNDNYEASFEEENIPEFELNIISKRPKKPDY